MFVGDSSRIDEGDRNVVVVDHTRRSLEVNGEQFVSCGFYINSISQYLRNEITLDTVLRDLTALGAQNVNHVYIYNMERLTDEDLALVLETLEDNNIMFVYSLIEQLYVVENVTVGFNQTEGGWESLIASADRVRKSSSLLGYYLCDDCSNFPLLEMSLAYTGLKKYDPFHPTFGADWSFPWANWIYGEQSDVGPAYDVPQVENYKDTPDMHENDFENRVGMFFEPMVNSPPLYLIGDQWYGDDFGEDVPISPPELEATLSFLSWIQFDAPGQVKVILFLHQREYQEERR